MTGPPYVMPDGSTNWRRPFEPGNAVARTHGLTNLMRREEPTPTQVQAIESYLESLLDEFPFLHEADVFELRALARLRYEIDELSAYADRVRAGEARVVLRGVAKGTPRTGLEAWYASDLGDLLGRLVDKASALSKNLGLNPVGRWAVAKDLYTAAKNARHDGLRQLVEEGLREIDAGEW